MCNAFHAETVHTQTSTLTTNQLVFSQPTNKPQKPESAHHPTLSDQNDDMVKKSVQARIYNLLRAIQDNCKGDNERDKSILIHGKALMNVATNYKYVSIHKYLVGEKKNVYHTNAAHPLLPGMSSDQVKEAWKNYLEVSGITDNPTIGNMNENVSYKKLMGWKKSPVLDDEAMNRHLLVMRVNEKAVASIRDGKCNENNQAKQVNNFVNSICQHWTSSSVNKSVSDSGDIVLSSVTLHLACQNAGPPDTTVGTASVAAQQPVQAKKNDDKATTGGKNRTPPSTPTRSPDTTVDTASVAAQQPVQARKNDDKAITVGRKRKQSSTQTRSGQRRR